MSEYTFAQLWLKNRLPLTTLRFSFYPGSPTVAVNNYLLPNRDYKTRLVGLSEKNKDWIPFFNSLDTANSVILELFKISEKFIASNKNYLGLYMTGLEFSPRDNKIWFAISVAHGYHNAYLVGDFNLTPTQLMDKIRSNEFKGTLYDEYWPDRLIKELPLQGVPDNVAGPINRDYMSLGLTNDFKNMSPVVFDTLRNILSKSYGHTVSKFQMD